MNLNVKPIVKSFNKTYLILLFFFSLMNVYSQSKGSIIGTVRDEVTGEPIIGANVLLENTSFGAASDLNGKFQIRDVEEGLYNIKISHVAYQTKIITNVEVKSKEVTQLNITLSSNVLETQEILVETKSDKSYENALLNLRKNSQNILDGISAEQIRRTTDGLTSDILKRITGLTINENKFVNIRGTSERYNVTQLNNSNITSTESEKKAFSFDLLSANLLEYANVIKSYTPDLPANFAGGVVQLNTISFPEYLRASAGYSTSYSEGTSLKSFSTYENGTNFFGFDNGSRKLPENFPDNLNKSGLNRDQINELAKSLKNIWQTKSVKAPLNQSFYFTIGDGTRLIGSQFGFVTAFSYKNDHRNSFINLNEYESSGEKRFEYEGIKSSKSVNLGGLLNLSYKFSDNHLISWRNLYSHSSDDEVSLLHGYQYTDAGKEQKQTAIRYTERDLLSAQIFGEHFFQNLNGLRVDWRFSLSNSRKLEPDYRRIYYGRDIGDDGPFYAVLGFQPNLKNGGRFFSNLHDKSRGLAVDFRTNLYLLRFKFGFSYDVTKRDFASRLISVIINAPGNGYTDFSLLTLPLDKIFGPENFRKNGFSIDEYQNGTNNYSASEEVISSYLMTEIPFHFVNKEIKIFGGFRMENSLQKINSMDVSGEIPISNYLKKIDYLPSINFLIKLNDFTNVRFSYSQTLNRPELRELAPFAYFDFATQTSIRGNPDLQRSFIKNYDLRIESLPGLGKLISANVFYKSISNAIEKVVVTGSALGSERTFMNADKAEVYGFELEGRISFGFISDYLENLSINGNYTRINSFVNVRGTETTISREKRPLQGQSPYVINFGIYFVEPSLGSSFTVNYNKIGKRIVEVATAYQDDIIEKPRDVIDIKISQTVLKGFSLSLGIKDLLAQDYAFVQGDLPARIIKANTTYSLGINYKLN